MRRHYRSGGLLLQTWSAVCSACSLSANGSSASHMPSLFFLDKGFSRCDRWNFSTVLYSLVLSDRVAHLAQGRGDSPRMSFFEGRLWRFYYSTLSDSVGHQSWTEKILLGTSLGGEASTPIMLSCCVQDFVVWNTGLLQGVVPRLLKGTTILSTETLSSFGHTHIHIINFK